MRIVVSSGFSVEKCLVMADAKAPIDVVGTGSFIPDAWHETYATADIVEYDGVPMVKVGVVRVRVRQPGVSMPMAVRLSRRVARSMRVLMVFVVHMTMLVLHRVVHVEVSVTLRQMQPDTRRHQHAGDDQLPRDRLAEERQRHHRARSENVARQASGRDATARDRMRRISGIRPSRRSGCP